MIARLTSSSTLSLPWTSPLIPPMIMESPLIETDARASPIAIVVTVSSDRLNRSLIADEGIPEVDKYEI